MSKIERSVYVVFPAALLDGWEVVKESSDQAEHFATREDAIAYAKMRGETDGGAVVRLENWYGDLERTLEVHSRPDSKGLSAASGTRAQAGSASISFASSFFGLLTRRLTG
jgi:hypothetical protein